MTQIKQLLVSVVAALAFTSVSASSASSRSLERRHVELVEPRPFKGTGYGPTNPLDSDGGNYPCKAPGGDGTKLIVDGEPTTWVIGEAQTVSFSGHAVHGGGSCQFALVEGFAPTKESRFKVILSVEGGCPKANHVGNLDAGQEPDKFSVTIPDDFTPGDYTFSWTWHNRGGSGEMYHLCSPITAVAKPGAVRRSKDRRQAAAAAAAAAKDKRQSPVYPDIFIANLGEFGNGCDTKEAVREQIAIKYPHPGPNVLHPEGTGKLFDPKCDGNAHNNGAAPAPAPAPAPSPAPSSGTTSSGTTTQSQSSTPVLTSSATSAPLPSSTIVTSSPVPSSSTTTTSSESSSRAQESTASPTTPSTTTAPPATSGSPPPPPATITGRPPTPANPQTPAGSCTDGHLLCVEKVLFSICTGGKWIKPQPLADNTVCVEEGESVGLNLQVLW